MERAIGDDAVHYLSELFVSNQIFRWSAGALIQKCELIARDRFLKDGLG
jgi:hypothetical protein